MSDNASGLHDDWSAAYRVPVDGRFVIDRFAAEPPPGIPGRKAMKKALNRQVRRLHDLQRLLYADGRKAVLAVFQGLDAAGKDSTIRHVFSGVNPAGFRVTSFGPPGGRECGHDFIWRCARALPERGRIGIFNRSHYEEVLVVRVHPRHLAGQGLSTTPDESFWLARFESIRAWEQHLARNGTVIVKFWLNVSMAEQARRFQRRIERQDKQWKFRLGDLETRERRTEYLQAYEALLRETSTDQAPWFAIPADSKPYMRLAVARIMVETLERMPITFPAVTPEQIADMATASQRLAQRGDGPS